MNKIYWWTKVKIENSSYSTDKEKLYNLIKEDNYIYFEYDESNLHFLFSPNTEIEIRDSDLFIANYYEYTPFNYNSQCCMDYRRLFLDDGDFNFKTITQDEFINFIRKNP